MTSTTGIRYHHDRKRGRDEMSSRRGVMKMDFKRRQVSRRGGNVG